MASTRIREDHLSGFGAIQEAWGTLLFMAGPVILWSETWSSWIDSRGLMVVCLKTVSSRIALGLCMILISNFDGCFFKAFLMLLRHGGGGAAASKPTECALERIYLIQIYWFYFVK